MAKGVPVLVVLRRAVLGFAAVVLILLAVSFSLFRLLLPELPQLQRDIEAVASQTVGKPLVIGEMEAEWSGWGPRLVFHDVSIRSNIDDEELIALRRLTVGTHILQLASDQPMRPAWVEAEGLRLVVEQKQNGGLRLRGFEDSGNRESDFLGPLFDFLAARGSISLGQTEVVWVPAEGSTLEPESAWFDLVFQSGGGRYHVELSGQPPASIGSDIELVLDAEGSMADMVNMKGEVFGRLSGFQLHSPWVQPLLSFLPLSVEAGRLEEGEVSLRWDRQQTTKITSRVSLNSLRLSLPNESEAQKDMHLVEGFEGDLSWSASESASTEKNTLKNLAALGKRWRLTSDKATLMVAGEPVQLEGLVLDSDLLGDDFSEQRFTGEVKALEWGGVFGQAEGLPFPEELGSLLQRLSPAGSLHVDSFAVARSKAQGLTLNAEGGFNNVSWHNGKLKHRVHDPEHKGWPGFDSVSGRFQVTERYAKLGLDSRNLNIDWPWLYDGKRQVDSFDGDIVIEWPKVVPGRPRVINIGAERLQLTKGEASAEVVLGLNLSLTKPKPTGRLRLSGDVSGGTVPLVKSFIPAFTPDTAHQWLDAALEGGALTAKVEIDGPLNGFPYENNEGKFNADAWVSDASLRFADNWPRIEQAKGTVSFRNLSMLANIPTAVTQGVPISGLRVHIPNLKRANVSVLASSRTQLPKLLRYVRNSPLLEPVAPVMKGLTGTGAADLTLSLQIPVTDIDSLAVQGDLGLVGGEFHSSDLLHLSNVTGRVGFTRERVVGRNVTGDFHGFIGNVQLDLSLTGGDMLVTADTVFSPDSSAEQREFVGGFLPPLVLNTLSGSTGLSVDLSGRDGAPLAEQIVLQSSLAGLAVSGPASINKTAEWHAPLKLVLDRSIANGMRVTASARGLGGADVWIPDGVDAEITRAEFAAGNAVATLPDEDKVGLVADLPLANLDSLLEWFADQEQPPTDGSSQTVSQSKNLLLPDFLDYLKFRGDKFHAFGMTWHALQAEIERTGNAAVLTLASADGAGTVKVPDRVVSAEQIANVAEATRALQKRRLAEQIEARFDYLYIPDLVRVPEVEAVGPPLPPAATPIDPRELPVVRASIKDARYMGVRLGQLTAETEPGVSGLVLRDMKSRGGWLDIDAKGRWDVYGSDHHSEIDVGIASKNWDAVMNGIALPDVLGAKATTMNVKLQWPGAITSFDAEQASGLFSVDFNQGQIYQVDPGIGRILGLFSFYTLPRRLLLDFSDIAKSGLTFDKIKGDFTFNGGDSWTDNLVINARGADAYIVGRAGVVAQDYDQRITVRPQIGGGTAVVGALVSGVGVGALMLIANELLGEPFDELGVLRFHLSGTWDEPLINGKPLPEKKAPATRTASGIQFGYPNYQD